MASNEDYVILFDENGSPYISHAFGDNLRAAASSAAGAVSNAAGRVASGVGRGVRQSHKYIQKIVENGKTRYFYTQEELKAYYNEKNAQTKQAVNKAGEAVRGAANNAQARMNQAGQTVRTAADKMATNARAASQNAQQAGKTAMQNVEAKLQTGKSNAARMRNDFRAKANQATENVKAAGQNAKETVKGVSEGVKAYREWDKNPTKETFDAVKNNKTASAIRQARLKAMDTLDNTAIKAASHLKGADVWEAYKAEKDPEKSDRLYEEWRKTPHGKFLNDGFIANAQVNGLKEAVSDSAKEASEAVKSAVSNAKESASSAVSVAKNAIQNGTATAKEYAQAGREAASDFVNRTKDSTVNAVEALRSSLSGIVSSVDLTQNVVKLSDGTKITIPQQYIKENKIPESFITEVIIPNAVKAEERVRENRKQNNDSHTVTKIKTF